MDITKHAWFDGLVTGAEVNNKDVITITHTGDYGNCEYLGIGRGDAIAIAKHFGLIDNAPRCPSCDSSTACGY